MFSIRIQFSIKKIYSQNLTPLTSLRDKLSVLGSKSKKKKTKKKKFKKKKKKTKKYK